MGDQETFALRRALQFVVNGKARTELLTVGPVEPIEGGVACFYRLPVLDGQTRSVIGSDEVHAVQICLRLVAQRIHDAIDNGLADVWWLEPGDRGGFLR